ncbi:MAG: TIGR02270 family protein [Gammaproteobacteria bacterium]|nr:TIGR02270 family protein [Gammaproteobacteria bacterium]MDH5802377.1 TIGR02270 family protein [Gammaproteobacteria bacterium]
MKKETPIIPAIINQYVDDCAFLWLLRASAVNEPHCNLDDLAKLDQRVDAALGGIRIAGSPAWEMCLQALEKEEPGEVFQAALLAFESGKGDQIDYVISKGAHTLENLKALVSALGWIPFKKIESMLHSMANANADPYRYLSIAAYAVHRADPGEILNQAIHDPYPLIQARAIRAVGELKRQDLKPDLEEFFHCDNEANRFWSAWSSILLGNLSLINNLLPFFVMDSPHFERTLQLSLRALDVPTAQSWLQSLSQFPDTLRHLLIGAGIIGDPMYIPWIIKQMADQEVARVAGEAFSMITGVDLEEHNFEADWPEGLETGPTEDPKDPNVAMDPDEDLPWPEPALVSLWWKANKSNFIEGTRYLAGSPITEPHCRNILKTGNQRQRAAAALELAIRNPKEPVFNVRAPGKRQKKSLGV